jgi:hypothetical protein
MARKTQWFGEQVDSISTTELLEQLENGGLITRVHAMDGLLERSQDDDSLLEIVVKEITSPKNTNAKLMGIITVADIGVASMLRVGTPKSISRAWEIILKLQEPKRSDLLGFLRSESLLTDEEISKCEFSASAVTK